MTENNDSNITISTLDIISDLSKVDARLADLYRRAVGAEDTGLAVPIVKTVLSNLIVYASTENEAAEAVRNVGEITGRHPSRAIIVDTVPTHPGEQPATVSVVCGITQRGDRQLCGEIIRIHAHETEVGLAGMVMPLLVGDVPVFLWISGEIPNQEFNFNELLFIANYLILDSRRVSDLRNVVDYLPNDDSDPMLIDICWSSLQLWREYTAQHFDPPAMREYITGIDKIDIKYTSKEINAPILFASWLIERIGLEISRVHKDNDVHYIEAARDNMHAKITLSPENIDIISNQLTSVVIRSQLNENTATFVTQSISSSELTLSEECPGVCLLPRVLEIPNATEAALVSEALETYRRDEVYEASLKIAVEIINRLSEDAG